MALNFLNDGYFAGKVGIGETSPNYNLVVGDGTTDTESRFYHSDASYTSVRGYGLFMSRGNSYIRPVNDGSQTLYIGADSKTWGTFSADANIFTLNRDGVSRLYIDSAGLIGIGTTSPSEKLEVQDGNIKIETTTNVDAELILNPYSSGLGTTYQWELVGKNSAGSYNFQIRENGTPYVTIDSSVSGNAGNVGIGTTSPSVALQLGNSTLGQTKLAIFNSEGGGEVGLTIQSRTNRAKLRVADNDSNAYVVAEAGKAFFGTSANGDATNVTVLTSGNVGIGTILPVGKLMLNSNWTNNPNETTDLNIKSASGRNNYEPQIVNKSDLGITYTVSSNKTDGPSTSGLTLHNDDTTVGGFSPMILFSKRETGNSAYKATMAAIYAR